MAVARWVRYRADDLGVDSARVSLGGASAGATLATGATLRLRDEDGWQPAALLTVYGLFHPVLPAVPAEREAMMDGIPQVLRFTPESTAGIAANYLGGPPESADGYAMPIRADLRGLCPVRMYDAEYDDLRVSADLFAAALEDAGVPVTRHLVPGVMHGFANLPPEITPVGEALQMMADAVGAA